MTEIIKIHLSRAFEWYKVYQDLSMYSEDIRFLQCRHTMSRQQKYVPIDAAVTSKCQSSICGLIIDSSMQIEFPKIGYKNTLPNYTFT